jgi:chorismate mutase
MSSSMNIEKPKIRIIGGPCSAESELQLLRIAEAGKRQGWMRFRAGIWKPRTRPGTFEGVGEKGLAWLRKTEIKTNIPALTEVATPYQAERVMQSGIAGFWLGARTTLNPFYVQEIAEAIKGANVEVWIKNPIHPDLHAWIGAIERIAAADVQKVGAIHRGFFFFRQSDLRNSPVWSIPLGLRNHFPKLDLFCDISHIAGRAERIPQILAQALSLHFSGVMAEIHDQPQRAMTDRDQQLDPLAFASIMDNLQHTDSTARVGKREVLLQEEQNHWAAVIEAEIQRLQAIKEHIPQQMDELISHFRIK